MHCTHLDIDYAVGVLSRFTSYTNKQHWKAIRRVFQHFKRTHTFALSYTGYPCILASYSNASWMIGSHETKSTNGSIFTLGEATVCWSSKKQICITHSTIQSDFLASSTMGTEASCTV